MFLGDDWFEPSTTSDSIFAEGLWQRWILDQEVPIPKPSDESQLECADCRRIAPILRHLGAPNAIVRSQWAMILEQAFTIRSDTFAPPVPPKDPNLTMAEPAASAVDLTQRLIAARGAGPHTKKKGASKRALGLPQDADEALGPLGHLDILRGKIYSILIALAKIHAERRIHDNTHPVPLPPLLTSSGSGPSAFSTAVESFDTMNVTAKPSVAMVKQQKKENRTSHATMKKEEEKAGHAFQYGPLVGFLCCGVRGLLVASVDKNVFPPMSSYIFLEMADELCRRRHTRLEEPVWRSTHDFIMNKIVETFHLPNHDKPPPLVTKNDLARALCKDFVDFWVKQKGFNPSNVPTPASLGLVTPGRRLPAPSPDLSDAGQLGAEDGPSIGPGENAVEADGDAGEADGEAATGSGIPSSGA